MQIHSSSHRRRFRDTILQWFAQHGRVLPWRQTRDPYRIWVSEVMLQQTQVDRVTDYYLRFLDRFPTVQHLAAAPWEALLERWRGLGYYGRARNLHKAAQAIATHLGGKFPTHVAELEKLPGIGPYTSRAIAVFAYEQDVLVLDTNTSRVLARVFGIIGDDLLKAVAQTAHGIVPRGKSWAFHQGLMDFGALICRAREPKCGECPLRRGCEFSQQDMPHPERKPRAPMFRIHHRGCALRPRHDTKANIQVAVGIIHRNGKLLITRRKKGQHLAGLWEFPGGKREPRESWRECLKREIAEELGLEVAVRPHDWTMDHEYDDRIVHLRFHRCSILAGEPQGREGQEWRWVLPKELSEYEFPEANQEVIPQLMRAKFVDPHS